MKTKEHILQNPTVSAILACFCCLLWGSAFPCIKLGYQLFAIQSSDTASQILFAGIRFVQDAILYVGFIQ